MDCFERHQALGQIIERRGKVAVAAGKDNLVLAFVGFDNEDSFVERIADSSDIAAAAAIVGAQIDDQYPARRQSGAGIRAIRCRSSCTSRRT